MSVIVRPYRKTGRWEVDISLRLPNGLMHRERKKAPVASKSGSQRWGEEYERHLLQHRPSQVKKEVSTLTEFAPRFVDEHARANRQKLSAIAATESILKWHLVPALGRHRLDTITNQEVQRLKLTLHDKAPKTVNNVLTVLSTVLKKAVEWGELERVPCTIKLLANPRRAMAFLDFEEYERLLDGSQTRCPDTYLMALLGGEAGLRLGEMVALEWKDVDLQARQLTIERSDWCGQVGVPKGGRSRRIPLTLRLATALKAFRHLRAARVFCLADGGPTTRDRVIKALRREEPSRDWRRRAFTSCVIPSARIWRCGGRRRPLSSNSLGTPI